MIIRGNTYQTYLKNTIFYKSIQLIIELVLLRNELNKAMHEA